MGCEQEFIFFLKIRKIKNGKKPKKKRTITARGTTVYVWAVRMTIWRRRAVSSHSVVAVAVVGHRRRRATTTDAASSVQRVGRERRLHTQVLVGPSEGAWRAAGPIGTRPACVCAPVIRGTSTERCSRAFPSEATTIFHSLPGGRVRVYGFAKLSSPPNPSHDHPSCVVHPAALVTFRAGTDFCLHLLSPRKDTPSSLNRTSVWQRGFLRFSSTLFSFFHFYFYLYARHFFFFNII